MTTTTLVQSRNGGKIHEQGCGHSSHHVSTLKGSENLTRDKVVEKYGRSLCVHCFPEARKPVAAPTPIKVEKTYCTGSGTSDWKFGKAERSGFHASNGGTCGHCGEWAGMTTAYSNVMRKHKAK